MAIERMTLVQSSMQFSDPRRAIRKDSQALMEMATGLDWDIIALSETVKGNRVYPIIRKEVERAGWFFQHEVPGDCRFIVNPKHKVLESGYVHVLDARTTGIGRFSKRGVAELTIETPGGNIITDHSTHWLTQFKLDRKPGPENRRERYHDDQTDAVVERVKLHGRGRRISFWQGDTNVDEDKDRGWDRDSIHHQFYLAGLVSVFDELNEYPSTHGRRTIDVIGSYDPDRRVTAQAVRVLPRNHGGQKRHVDHLIVVAQYHIRRSQRVEA